MEVTTLRRDLGVLDRARLERAGAGEDRVADRRAALGRRRAVRNGDASAASPGRSTPASRAWSSPSTAAPGQTPRSPRSRHDDTWVQWKGVAEVERGRPHGAGARHRQGRPGADRRRARRGPRRRHRVAHGRTSPAPRLGCRDGLRDSRTGCALVVGGSGGLGLAVVRDARRRGAPSVALTYRSRAGRRRGGRRRRARVGRARLRPPARRHHRRRRAPRSSPTWSRRTAACTRSSTPPGRTSR